MKCKECNGAGFKSVMEYDATANRDMWEHKKCPKCNGTGQDNKEYSIKLTIEEIERLKEYTLFYLGQQDLEPYRSLGIKDLAQLTNRVQELENENA